MKVFAILLAVIFVLQLSYILYQHYSPSVHQEISVSQDSTATHIDSTVSGAADTSAPPPAAVVRTDTAAAAPAPLTLVIRNLRSPTSQVVVGVYGMSNKFPDPNDQMKEYRFKPNGDPLIARITDLPFGEYALAIYQDVNENGKIDKNLIGIPTEPYAFSQNYKPTVRAPAFKDCSFGYTATDHVITMIMSK